MVFVSWLEHHIDVFLGQCYSYDFYVERHYLMPVFPYLFQLPGSIGHPWLTVTKAVPGSGSSWNRPKECQNKSVVGIDLCDPVLR